MVTRQVFAAFVSGLAIGFTLFAFYSKEIYVPQMMIPYFESNDDNSSVSGRNNAVITDWPKRNDIKTERIFSAVKTKVTKSDETKNERSSSAVKTDVTKSDAIKDNVTLHLKPCPDKPPISETKVALNLLNVTYEDLLRDLGHVVGPGGHYAPSACKSREKLAVIIPYRDRQRNLFILLHNLIPFLVKQQAEFSIFVVEQVGNSTFNKGVMIDVGFVMAKALDDFSCFIVHDTDLIPRDLRNLYRCANRPVHLMLRRSGESRKKPETLPYRAFIGGAIALRKEHFEKSNGWSVSYYGWGQEDDDLEMRLRRKGLMVTRGPINIGDYYELGHTQWEPGRRDKIAKVRSSRFDRDGLSSLNYTLVKEEKRELFHWYLIKPPPPPPDLYPAQRR